jgi:hypothetical protein
MPSRLRYRALPTILWAGALAVVVALVVALVIRASGGEGDTRPVPRTDTARAVAPDPRSVPLPPAIPKLALRFVKTAVMRTHASRATLLQGWRLAGPKLRQGTTLHEWLGGTSSVVPFPDGAVAPHLQVDHSYARDALIELALYPEERTHVSPAVFLIGFHRYGSGTSGRWLVDYWAPHGSSSMPAAAG